jgi:hypothetical protein
VSVEESADRIAGQTVERKLDALAFGGELALQTGDRVLLGNRIHRPIRPDHE